MTEKIPAYNWNNADNNKMAENKLTLADCYKYNKATITSVPTIHVFSNVKVLIEYAHENMLTIQEIIDFNNLKLILRSIEQLTDEEKAQLLENHLNDQGRDILKRSSYSYGNFENRLYELDVKQTDYLRSISVDIDNFLKSGKAVKG